MINHSHHLTLQTADPSCALNIIHYHLNTLWLEPGTLSAPNRPLIRRKVKRQVWFFGCPPICILLVAGHPGRDGHILSPLGDFVSACLATPFITLTVFCPIGGRREVINRAWLVALTLPARHWARIFGDEGIGGLRLDWRAARAEPCGIEEYAGTAAAPSHTHTRVLLWHTSVKHRGCLPMQNAWHTTGSLYSVTQWTFTSSTWRTMHYRLYIAFYTCGGNGLEALHCSYWFFTLMLYKVSI